MPPKVSVLMSVYNGATHLREAVESIKAQTWEDFEFIVIDDGSTDESGSILAEYLRLDARVKIHTQNNHGLAAALNTGLDLARGKYVARMDADDISVPERLATQVSFMEAHPEV